MIQIADIQVFMCHASSDKPLVRELTGELPKWILPWIDESKVNIGESLDIRLETAIKQDVKCVIVFVSEAAQKSNWVRKEVEWAKCRKKSDTSFLFLPVLLPGSETYLSELGLGNLKALRITGWSKSEIRSAAVDLSQEISKITNEDTQFQSIVAHKGGSGLISYLFALQITLAITGLIGAAKIITFEATSEIKLLATASAIFFPVSFAVSSVIQEYFGPVVAKRINASTCVSMLVAIFIFQIYALLPGSEYYQNQEALQTLTRPSIGFLIAGTIAYYVGQYFNSEFYNKLRRYSVLGGFLSALCASSVETCVFISLAYYALEAIDFDFGLDQLPFTALSSLMAGQLLIRYLATIAVYPVVREILRTLTRPAVPR